MDEFSLYITVPGRKGRKATEKKLADVMQKTKSASLNVTWIMEGRQAGWSGICRVIGFLKHMERKPGKRTIRNTLEFRSRRNHVRLLLPALSRRRFRIVYQASPPEKPEKLFQIAKAAARRGIIVVVQDSSASPAGWLSWLNDPDYRPIEPYLDYLKIFMGHQALSCHYHSCLGRTLALDGNGRWSICPYRESTVCIRDPAACDSLGEIFRTEEFAALLRKQITVRDRCTTGCRYYPGCKGGCPLLAETPCPEPALLQALQAAVGQELPDISPAVREEKICQLSQRFTI